MWLTKWVWEKKWIILFCGLTHITYAANVFITTNNPPKGFEYLNQPQINKVDVYFAGKFLGSFFATYTPTTLAFNDPQQIVALMPNLTNQAMVQQALTGKIAANTDYVGKNLSPEIAGVIFNPNNFRVDVFVNGKYWQQHKPLSELLPKSSAGLSLIEQVDAVVAGNIGDNSGYGFNLQSNSIIGYKEGQLNIQVSYAQNSADENFAYANNLRIDELNAEWYHERYKFMAGMLSTDGSDLLVGQNILGVSARTTLDTLSNRDQTEGSSLTIFLPLPSQVSIYKEGRLLASRFYQAGNQLLDTSNLPTGAYDITLKITSNGTITEQTRFYVKTGEFPPLKYPTYYVNAGVLQEGYVNTNSIFPEVTSVPVAQIGANKRITSLWGVLGSAMATTDEVVGNAGLFFIGKHYLLKPQILVSSDQDLGVAIYAQLYFGNLTANISGLKIWSKEIKTCASNDFCPITPNSTSGSISLAYPLANVLFTLNGLYNKDQDDNSTYSYGPGMQITLMHLAGNPLNLNLTATRTQDELIGLATLSIGFSAPSWNGNFVAGQRGTHVYNNNGNLSDAGTIVSGQIEHSWLNAAQDGLTLGAQASSDAGVQTVEAQGQYTDGIGMINAQIVNQSGNGVATNTNYSANYDNRFVFTGNKVGFGGSHGGNNGVLVNIESGANSGKFEVLDNDSVVKVVNTNTATPVFLNGFSTHEISIRATADSLFEYDQTAQTVTLYDGNFMLLNWQAQQKFVLFTRIIDEQGSPIKNALVEGGVGFNTTDEEGYLQTDIFDSTKQLRLKTSAANSCIVSIPQLKPQKGLAEVSYLICKTYFVI